MDTDIQFGVLKDMKTIYKFKLSKEERKALRDYAHKLYDELEKKHRGCIVAEYSTIQRFLNDFFVLNEHPWGGSLNL